MFEEIKINLADQWTNTTVGNIVESAIFYRKVRLIIPASRLINLLTSAETIPLLTRLIDDGHLSIELEQFPAGELANDMRLLSSPLTDALHSPIRLPDGSLLGPEEKSIKEVMDREYRFDDRLLTKIRIEALSLWDATDDPRSIRAAEALIGRIIVPPISDAYVGKKLARLKTVLDYSKDWLLQDIVADGAGSDDETITIRGEEEKYGLVFPVIRTSFHSPASLLDAVSFAGFMMEQAERSDFDDVFTSDRFNVTMRRLYARSIGQLTGRWEIDTFQASVLDTLPIRELFDRGQINRTALLAALDAKEQLLAHTVGKPADMNLTKWYFEQVNRQPISGTMKRKTIRFGAFTAPGVILDLLGTGGVGTAIGVGLGVFDTFILDRLAKHEGPATFVDGPLRDLVTLRSE